jgi:hypothetical protein
VHEELFSNLSRRRPAARIASVTKPKEPALNEFQKDKGMAVTGKLDRATLDELDIDTE